MYDGGTDYTSYYSPSSSYGGLYTGGTDYTGYYGAGGGYNNGLYSGGTDYSQYYQPQRYQYQYSPQSGQSGGSQGGGGSSGSGGPSGGGSQTGAKGQQVMYRTRVQNPASNVRRLMPLVTGAGVNNGYQQNNGYLAGGYQGANPYGANSGVAGSSLSPYLLIGGAGIAAYMMFKKK